MNHDFLKTTIDLYKDAGCSDKSIEYLHYLESRCERLCLLLEEYRHLQPEGLFSEETLQKIVRLQALHEEIYREEEHLQDILKSIYNHYREVACLEAGIEYREAHFRKVCENSDELPF